MSCEKNIQVDGAPPAASETTADTPEEAVTSQQPALSEVSAVILARGELTRRGFDSKRYNASIEREGDVWIVTFLGKQPRPPGDLVRVLVGPDGAIREVYRGK